MIPVDDPEAAADIVKAFNVDVLVPVSADVTSIAFIEQFPHLKWLLAGDGFWVQDSDGWTNRFLSILHPIEYIKRTVASENVKKPLLLKWKIDDPICLALTAMFGSYPEADATDVPNYEDLYKESFQPKKLLKVQGNVSDFLTPNSLTAVNLYLRKESPWGSIGDGLFVGKANDFKDIVLFWNLRAAGNEILFFDPSPDSRLYPIRDRFVMRQRGKSGTTKPEGCVLVTKEGMDLTSIVDDAVLQVNYVHSNFWKNRKVGTVHFAGRSRSVLATVESEIGNSKVVVPLPEKPFSEESAYHKQHLMVMIDTYRTNIFADGRHLFPPPHLQKLNEYFGRKMWLEPWGVRSSKNGVGFIIRATTEHLHLSPLETTKVISKLFENRGIKCELSRPGRIAHRLVQQMGGLQACRVFKISGVRELIRKYKAHETFTRSDALQIIRAVDPRTGLPQFSDFENLYIEPREQEKLKPEQVFSFLLKKHVFRVGLDLHCPNCELDFWKHLDDLASVSECDNCGEEFNLTLQLRDRDWKYKRSGIFGRDDSQGGAVPVVVTLQQLERTIAYGRLVYSTATTLEPLTADIEPCETDFIVMIQSPEGKIQILIGECKANQEITAQDIRKMMKVAAVLSDEHIEVYVVCSKTGTFTQEEVDLTQQFRNFDIMEA